MSHLLIAKDELWALHDLLQLILREGNANGNYLEVLSCLLTIQFDSSGWESFCRFRDDLLRIGGDTVVSGWQKASRVYNSKEDRPTKPSYLKRLTAYPDRPRKCELESREFNQLDKICIELASKPGYSNLSFVIFRPADLYDQFRPGYVPCPIAGDFKFREGRLNLSVMFRTNDAFAVGYADIYNLRLLQQKILLKAQQYTTKTSLKEGQIGDLNLYFSRTFVEKYKTLRDKNNHNLKRVKVIPMIENVLKEIESQKYPKHTG